MPSDQKLPGDLFGLHADPLFLSILDSLSEPGFKPGWVDPDKQSVAVLPFLNVSNDAEQEYFADGLTEDLITELSRFKNLFVISGNSSFRFKGRSAKAQDIGRELGARYVVVGSVRKAGNRVRITSQLIETANGSHLWAEHYDRDLTDIFAVQDDVVRAIVVAIPGEVGRKALEQARRKAPENLTAYECELRGRWALHHWSEGLAAAARWYEKAVEADPGFAAARAGLATIYAFTVYALGDDHEVRFPLAREHIGRAVAEDGDNYLVQQRAARVYLLIGEQQLALQHADRAYALNPNDYSVLQIMGEVLNYSGRMQEALEWYDRSQRIEPYAPDDTRLDCICDTYYMLRQYEKVVQIHSVYQNVPAFLHVILAVSLAQLGRLDESRAAMVKFHEKRLPGQDPVKLGRIQAKLCSRPEDQELWLEGYRKAGIEV